MSQDKASDCFSAGQAVMHLLKRGILPSDIMMREAFENAITWSSRSAAPPTPCCTCSPSPTPLA